jgi:ribonuclease HI
MVFKIYTDGASRGNPGISASGYVVFDGYMKMVGERYFYNGKATNNAAEYKAVIGALEFVLGMVERDKDIELYSDSQIVVRQLKGDYKVREAGLKELHGKALALLSSFKSYKLFNVPREDKNISYVDRQLNHLLDGITAGV